jgi:hypothetical protein
VCRAGRIERLSTGSLSLLTDTWSLITLVVVKRLLFILLALAALIPALLSGAQLAQMRMLRTDLAAAGCFSVAAELGTVRTQDIYSVSAVECRDQSGQPLSPGATLDKIAQGVWSAPAPSFDLVAATAYRSRDGEGAIGRTYSYREMLARWGPRTPGLDWPLPDLARSGWVVYLALPAVLVAVVAPVALGVAAARRGAVIVFWHS